ncbi:MAG: AmmeMemoRadiSam system protein B [Candidatus Aminicenantes bacterium]|nr:AmmeMemoRadiSam system protein B [Candidatus Aminicenantes bacterium]
MVRKPVVAGSFYPGSKSSLEKELSRLIPFVREKKKVIGLISPHAGYVYSGGCAGKGFGSIQVPGKVIILGVNHRGMGHSVAVDGSEHWNTPLGDVAIEMELAEKLVKNSDIFRIDFSAGAMEHSLEVQVPFIQYINPRAGILPITISCMDLEQLLAAGQEIGRMVQGRDDVLLVASTDMSHYISAESAKVKDQKAIDKILAMDPEGLFETVMLEKISMCGMAPTVMMLSAAIQLGAKASEVIQYTNSGEASGDYDQVVGYLSMAVY